MKRPVYYFSMGSNINHYAVRYSFLM